jgi:hypothetical protein
MPNNRSSRSGTDSRRDLRYLNGRARLSGILVDVTVDAWMTVQAKEVLVASVTVDA